MAASWAKVRRLFSRHQKKTKSRWSSCCWSPGPPWRWRTTRAGVPEHPRAKDGGGTVAAKGEQLLLLYDGLVKMSFPGLLIYRNSLRAAPCLVFKTMSYPNSLKAVAKTCCNIANACLDEVGAAANSSAAGLIVAFAVTVAFVKPLFETLASALLAGIWRVKSRTNSQNRAATSNTYIIYIGKLLSSTEIH